MNAYWKFARWMLRYKRLIVIAGIAAVLEALCAMGGFGTMILVIRQFFGGEHQTVRTIFEQEVGESETINALFDPMPIIQLIPNDAFYGFLAVVVVVLMLALMGGVMRFTHQYTTLTMSLRTTMRVRKTIFAQLLHAPLELVMTQGSADNLSRIIRDSAQLGRGLHLLTGRAVRDVLLGVGFLLMALWFDPLLTGIFLFGLLPIGVSVRKFGKRIRRASKHALHAYGDMVGAVQEPMQALAVVKTYGGEGYERRRFNTINRRVYKQEARARTAKALSSPVIELMAIAGVGVVALVATWWVFRSGRSEPHDMVNVLLALAMAGNSMRPLANLNNQLQVAAAAAVRLDELMNFPVEPNVRGQHKQDAPALPRHQRDVQFEHVTYHYPESETPALQGVSLHAEHGQTIAIVGPNGSGKSTLLSLLPRLMPPREGRVLIDGHDISQHSLRSLRRQIALVSQHTVIFSGTIRDNVAYGRRYASQDQIERAARAAYAHEFITTLPAGYDTVLGEGGTGLSGGQKQRLAIARAVLRDPAILILDEATSQIDSQSEAQINAALTELRSGRTTFIIAHRLSTVVDADRIAVMDAGRIIDQGTHDELLSRCELYQTLTRTQLAPSMTASPEK